MVRPRFWGGYTRTGRGRSAKTRDTIRALKGAFNGIIHLEAQLSFVQRRELFPYIFWPPLPGWCLVPFDMQACPKGIRTDDGDLNPLIYGLGDKSVDHVWKQGVLGIFQPRHRCYQLFDHLLIAVHFPWQDDSMPEEVPMWGLVHYQKGSDTAYVHVLTEWQVWVSANPAGNKRWADGLVQTLTGEAGIDKGLFLGDNPAISIKWVPNRTGPDWDKLGWRGEATEELGDMTYLYMIHAAMHLAVYNVQDDAVPGFGEDEANRSVAQALLGVSTALEHGEEGDIASASGGIKEELRKNAPDAVRELREILDELVPEVAADCQKALGSRLLPDVTQVRR